MAEVESAGLDGSVSHSPTGEGNTEPSIFSESPNAHLVPNESYDSELTLSEREQKWGFTLGELRSAAKVVSKLFCNPSLFVGDPYLADSRLYIMITRDRKTKRENREVYKTIMNEEKSRRKRYERMRDVEAINCTGMKRERLEALSVLTRADAEGGSSPLLLCWEQCSQDGFAQPTKVGDDELGELARPAESCKKRVEKIGGQELTTTEVDLLRLMGAFENLLRLQQVLRGEPIDPASKSPSASADPGSPSAKAAPSSPSFSPPAVDWVAATQLSAQVRRFLPHPFGSQMPPALIVGALPRPPLPPPGPTHSHAHGLKLDIARQLLAQSSETGAMKKKRKEEEKEKEKKEKEEGEGLAFAEGELAQLLRGAGHREVVLHRLPGTVRLDQVETLRELITTSGQSPCDCEEGGALQTHCSLCDDPQHLLDAIELALTEGGVENVEESVAASLGGLSFFSSESLVEQTLNLFIARRLYCNERLVDFGSSPIVIERNAPISESEEPDEWSIFEDVQQYACVRYDNLKLSRWRSCSTCKVRFNVLHPYYYSMCHLCGEFNYNKRLLARDLRSKVVLLTGCRIKIGYAMALSLLRCGAVVLGTTRFVHEAVARFQQEADYAVWRNRLNLFSLDLRDLWVVTQFCGFVRQRYPKLFAIINNAAQTIARTPQYTAHLRQIEANPSPDLRRVIEADSNSREWHSFFLAHSTTTVGQPLTIEYHPNPNPYLALTAPCEETDQTVSVSDSSLEPHESVNAGTQSHLAIVAGQAVTTDTGFNRTLIFDRYDTQAEESDHRETNSWVMKLAEVQGSEAAEVMTINALSPFILNSKLKPCLMNREGDGDDSSARPEPRFIINVSAMEGQFYRFKQTTHPHTNMAKAALNMMTRTSAEDYAKDDIYMNSVDTGWITDESPKLQRDRRTKSMALCPLDEVDAAARCLDPIYTNSTAYGLFFKDFREIPW